MTEAIKKTVKWFKEDPKEAFANLLVMIMLFGFLYTTIWIDAIISGRV